MEILNKYKPYKPTFVLDRGEYFDYVLAEEGSDDVSVYMPVGEFTTDCLSAYIDFSNDDTFKGEHIESLDAYHWDKAVNGGLEFKDIGFTGFDNGLLWYNVDDMCESAFHRLIQESTYEIPEGNLSLLLYPVNGVTKQFSYGIEKKDGYVSFNGGFYQGFFEANEKDYKILPRYIDDEWNLEFVIRPSDYQVRKDTLDRVYPENRGIFFYMGTRAENKFAPLYGLDLSGYPDRNLEVSATCENYFPDEYLESGGTGLIDQSNNTDYGCSGDTGDSSGDTIYDSNGDEIGKRYQIFSTDNKYLFFDRTNSGYTVDTWVEGSEVEVHYESSDSDKNLYLIVNRTESGLTSDTIDRLKDIDYNSIISGMTGKEYVEKPAYDLIGDFLSNAFALKVNDDMSVGYRYLELDCDNEEGYKISEESTLPDIIKKDEWSVINVKVKSIPSGLDECGLPLGERKIKIYVYVNGYLKLVSKELSDFNFKALNDIETRQEGVAFNISVGGGTQGLAESMWDRYDEAQQKVLPLEQNFAGSFIGDMRSFKFYTCRLSLNQIRNNYLFEIYGRD